MKYVYTADWQLKRRSDGKPIERPNRKALPCATCPKIPQGVHPCPENAVELSEKNRACWQHYRECRATGRWPDDGLVAEHAAAIREVDDAVQLSRGGGLLDLIAQSVKGRKRG